MSPKNLTLGELAANKRNPRKISEKKLSMLRESLEAFGDLGGTIFNVRTKQLVGGHQRQKSFSADTPISIEHRYDPPTKVGTVAEGYYELEGERFRYREVDWDEATETAALIAANKGAGEWDLPQLSELLLDLDAMNFNLDLTMFDGEEREKVIVPVEHVPPAGDPDATPEPKKESPVKPGDVYLLGNHRLMCGDSTSITDVECLMNDTRADTVITDPPYGISYQSNYRGEKFDKLKNDDVVLEDWVGCAEAVSIGWVIFFVGWQRLGEWLRVGSSFGRLTNILVWRKAAAMGDLEGSFSPAYELALAYNRGAKLNPDAGRPSAVIECNIDSAESFAHPTQKPVKLLEHLMAAIPCKTVLDLFGGSGTTLIAAEKTGRRAFLMELDPIYCRVIIERWQAYTGQEAVLLQSEGPPVPWRDVLKG